jgi:opacity protein-like surface antigen
MMRLTSLIACAVILGLICTNASAQIGRELGLSGGISFIQDQDFHKELWKRGYMGGVSYGYSLADLLTLQAMIEYGQHPIDADKIEELRAAVADHEFEDNGADYKILAVFAAAKVNPVSIVPGTFPYAIGGAGIVNVRTDDLDMYGTKWEDQAKHLDKSQTATALTLGLGFEWQPLPKISFFLEGRYVRAFLKMDDIVYYPVKAGINVSL